MKKLAPCFSILLIALLFSGCVSILSADTTISIDKNEKWAANLELLFEGESFEEFGQQLVDGLNLLASEGLNNDLDIQFKKLPDRQGNVPYEVIISGAGLDKLNEFLGTPGAFTKTEVDGETLIEFELEATNLSSGGLDIGFAPELSFTVEGLRVLTTNGKKNSPTSVTWMNPDAMMQATFTTSSSQGMAIPWWVILLIGITLIAIVVVILLIAGVFKKKQPPTLYVTPPTIPPTYPPPLQPTNSMETVVVSRVEKPQVSPILPVEAAPPPIPPRTNAPPPLPPVNE